jgi:tripartite-type tricarboxylate transporter receptor subunit TctC
MLTAAGEAAAESPDKKTVTMVINFGVGGNVDIEGRIVQRHLGRHLDGNPRIVVQNVPGYGGLTAINQLGSGIGVGDPSATIGFVNFNLFAGLIEDPALKVKTDVFRIVAGVGQWFIAYARKDALPGAKRPADIANAKNIRAGGYARSSSHDIRLRLMFDLIGTEGKVVTGFRSTRAINNAVAHGEINFMLSALSGYHVQALPTLIEPGIAIPMWQLGANDSNGKLIGSSGLAARGVRFFEDVYKEAHGKLPSGPKYDALRLSNDTTSRLARLALMPPGASAKAVSGMRKAFEALGSDRAFTDEYKRVTGTEPALFDATEAEKSLSKATNNVDPAVKAALKHAAGRK